ncbi:MAG TPA: hypothetical protein VMW86_01930 [Dehalococcoidales bacterium]|nr:hypothetical protein [Dehalococcoidales bacterium]
MVSQGTEKTPAREEKPKKIMTQPLPQILDDIENSIRLADEAADNARKAADEARKAGEKAAKEAERVASEAIARVEKIAKDALQLAELLNSAVKEAVAVLDKKLTKKA